MYEPPITEAEAKSEGFELEDYEADIEIIEVWPDNERALELFQRIGTKWLPRSMGGVPHGLRWEAIYPMMDRLKLADDEWNEVHDDLTVMESAALETMIEFAPKPKPKT